jgi:predicted glycosyltransferase
VRIWIDLANSPHAPLFAPISRRLEEDGHEVLVTARDNAQTVELARRSWQRPVVIGGRSEAGRVAKGRALAARVRQLAAWARRTRPDVALSHNSYAQIAAARGLGIRAVTAMDYEHQPANHLGFRLANVVLMPEALRRTGVERQGAAPSKARFYRGLKEEIYLGDFEPDPGALHEAGVVPPGPGEMLVVTRTPPSGALYHRSDNPLFRQILNTIGGRPEIRCVALCRHPEQHRELSRLAFPNLVLPRKAVDARSLMHAADLVIGAGGTMTREAALLGVPTVSIFSGRGAAVDRWLEQRDLLRRLKSVADLPPLRPRTVQPRQPAELRARETELIDEFVQATCGARRAAPTPVHG